MDRRNALKLTFATMIVGSTATLAAAAQGSKAELLMFEDPGCPYCRQWRREVGQAYTNSEEGRRAPLRSVALNGPMPVGVVLALPVRATPTFVLIEDGREVGRLTGYGGADFFWGMLEPLIKRLKPGQAA